MVHHGFPQMEIVFICTEDTIRTLMVKFYFYHGYLLSSILIFKTAVEVFNLREQMVPCVSF